MVLTLIGWGAIPDDHPLMAGMVGLQTSHRYGNATILKRVTNIAMENEINAVREWEPVLDLPA